MSTTAAGVIEITVMGGDDYKIDFARDKTVGDYLNEAGIDIGEGESVSLNGEEVKSMEDMVSPEGQIVVASRVSNG